MFFSNSLWIIRSQFFLEYFRCIFYRPLWGVVVCLSVLCLFDNVCCSWLHEAPLVPSTPASSGDEWKVASAALLLEWLVRWQQPLHIRPCCCLWYIPVRPFTSAQIFPACCICFLHFSISRQVLRCCGMDGALRWQWHGPCSVKCRVQGVRQPRRRDDGGHTPHDLRLREPSRERSRSGALMGQTAVF